MILVQHSKCGCYADTCCTECPLVSPEAACCTCTRKRKGGLPCTALPKCSAQPAMAPGTKQAATERSQRTHRVWKHNSSCLLVSCNTAMQTTPTPPNPHKQQQPVAAQTHKLQIHATHLQHSPKPTNNCTQSH
jgi:hypothetical protein